jgi:hypothetical protein
MFAIAVVLAAGCGKGSAADSQAAAGSPGGSSVAPAAPAVPAADRGGGAAPTPRPDLGTGAVAGTGAGAPTADRAEQLERLRATLHEMDDLVTELRAGRYADRSDECKKIERLAERLKSLSAPGLTASVTDRATWAGRRSSIDMALDDIVDGRCGSKPIGRPADFADFYASIHKALGELLALCEPAAAAR